MPAPRRHATFLLCAAAAVLAVSAAAGAEGEGYEAVTKPSRDLDLSFVRAGKIAEVLVHEGQLVQPGQALLQQDDRVEQIQLRELKQKAEDEGNIRNKAAAKKLEQTMVDLKELEDAATHGAATEMEVQHSRLEMEMAGLSLDVQKLTQEADRMKYQEMKAAVDQMRLESPVAGRVEEIYIREGEAAPAGEKAIRVVRLDPLWVDLLIPLEDSRRLRVGGPAEVTLPSAIRPVAAGKITFIASVAVAERRTVRVEIPNPAMAPAGEPAKVSFPPQPAVDQPIAPPARQPTTWPAGETKINVGVSSP